MRHEMARGEITGKKPKQSAERAKRQPGPPRRVDPHAIEPTPHGEPSAAGDIATAGSARGPPTPPAVYTIATFCAAHHISEAMFFKMRVMGIGPREARVGTRVLISFESARDWRAERERAAAATAAE